MTLPTVLRLFVRVLREHDERIYSLALGIDALNTAIDALTKNANDTAQRITDAQNALQAEIVGLKAHPAAPDLTDQITRLNGIASQLAAIDPVTTPPTTPEVAAVVHGGDPA